MPEDFMSTIPTSYQERIAGLNRRPIDDNLREKEASQKLVDFSERFEKIRGELSAEDREAADKIWSAADYLVRYAPKSPDPHACGSEKFKTQIINLLEDEKKYRLVNAFKDSQWEGLNALLGRFNRVFQESSYFEKDRADWGEDGDKYKFRREEDDSLLQLKQLIINEGVDAGVEEQIKRQAESITDLLSNGVMSNIFTSPDIIKNAPSDEKRAELVARQRNATEGLAAILFLAEKLMILEAGKSKS